MNFHLKNMWDNFTCLQQLVKMLQGVVGDSDRPQLAALEVLLHRLPALLPEDGVVGAGHIGPLHPRPVDEEEVEVVRLKLFQCAVDCGLAFLASVVLGTELRSYEKVLSLQAQLWQRFSEGVGNCLVVPEGQYHITSWVYNIDVAHSLANHNINNITI